MSVIGEAALSVVLELIFGKLVSSAMNFVEDHKEVREQLKQWQSIYPDIQAVLNDAEERQIKSEHVKRWLSDLQHLAYDVDDILDEFAYEELHLKLQKSQAQASTSKVRKLIPACCITSSFTPAAFKFNTRMISTIKEITTRLNDLTTRRSRLGLIIRENNEGVRSSRIEARRQKTTSLPDETHVFGRENEKKKILGWFKSNLDKVSVLPIIGMGGMGKTTLAQFVYNHDDVKENFDLKAWACVSEEFDAFAITKTILQSVMHPESCPDPKDNLDLLQRMLEEKLSGKRFLLVLDDVWNDNPIDLYNLMKPLGVGTKMILTTRSEKVASIIRTIEPCMLDKLSYEDCLLVFTKYALDAYDFSGRLDLEEVGKNIVKKCDGLPLAAKAIGGLLRNEDNKKWEKVSKSEIWELSENQCGIIPALRLSYHCLPPHLKRCFAYCSILPKDYEFTEEEITLLWKAEGFLQQNSEYQDQELGKNQDLGKEYFWELVTRSLFQRSSKDDSRFGMHDLMNDLAQLVAGDICSKLEGDKQKKLPMRTRHSSYIGYRYDGVKRFEAFDQVRHLRTFLPLMLPREGHYYLTNYVLDELLPRLGCLRVLSLSGYAITELPDVFENLKHLRHLDFSYTSIKILPHSIYILHHLETLILRKCRMLEELPSEMGNLFKLQHLDIRGANVLRNMPLGIDKLINLQRLSNLILGEGKGSRIREIRNFSCLRGDICLSGLDNINEEKDAREAMLSDKSEIDELELRWSKDFDNSKRNEKVEEKVLNFLRPHNMIKKLRIENYGGINFSPWITDPSFKNLSSLKLINCRHCNSLPSIGRLPLLKDVLIAGMVGVTKVGVELFGDNSLNAFALLEGLCFEDMLHWKELDCCEGEEQEVLKFPKLRELTLLNCPQLVGRLPSHLHSLQKLKVNGCQRLVVSISSVPFLCELEIRNCEELMYGSDADFRSLKKIYLENIDKVGIVRVSSCLETEAEEIEEEKLHLAKISSIESLTIKECEKLYSRLSKVFYSFIFLTEMKIEDCSSLVSLSDITFIRTLKKLKIVRCKNLQCLVEERENMVGMYKTSLLEHLQINNCDSLVCLSSREDVVFGLQHILIFDCSKLSCLFLNGKLPIRLKELDINNCPELESTGEEVQETNCLESIWIENCEKMKSLPRGFHKLIHLQNVRFMQSSDLAISEGDESWLPTHLQLLIIYGCPKLGALLKSINNFTSLRFLNVDIDKSLVELGFHKLTCLQGLVIDGKGCSEEEIAGMMMQLPSSLSHFYIEDFNNLKCISSRDFQNLTSLERLVVCNCPKLTSLPEKHMLLSLGHLYIHNCPLLKEEWEKDKGREWSKIAQIPLVEIDNKTIIPKHHER